MKILHIKNRVEHNPQEFHFCVSLELNEHELLSQMMMFQVNFLKHLIMEYAKKWHYGDGSFVILFKLSCCLELFAKLNKGTTKWFYEFTFT